VLLKSETRKYRQKNVKNKNDTVYNCWYEGTNEVPVQYTGIYRPIFRNDYHDQKSPQFDPILSREVQPIPNATDLD
jgi:hypothetical protein